MDITNFGEIQRPLHLHWLPESEQEIRRGLGCLGYCDGIVRIFSPEGEVFL